MTVDFGNMQCWLDKISIITIKKGLEISKEEVENLNNLAFRFKRLQIHIKGGGAGLYNSLLVIQTTCIKPKQT